MAVGSRTCSMPHLTALRSGPVARDELGRAVGRGKPRQSEAEGCGQRPGRARAHGARMGVIYLVDTGKTFDSSIRLLNVAHSAAMAGAIGRHLGPALALALFAYVWSSNANPDDLAWSIENSSTAGNTRSNVRD
jgi:hypothetical protein